MTEERINQLIAKKSLTTAERAEVRAAAEEADITYTIKQGCRTCYEQVLVKLYEVTVKEMATSKDGYKFKRAGMSFVLAGKVYSNATIADVEVGKLHPVIRRTYFVKPFVEVKEEEDNDGQGGEL